MTTSNAEGIADYLAQSREFMVKARQYLAAGDLHQASEKGWGAASHMVKAVALAQGWRYEWHSDFNRLLNDLAIDTENDRVFDLRGAANVLHGSFYERRRNLNGKAIQRDLSRVAELLDLLDPLTRMDQR